MKLSAGRPNSAKSAREVAEQLGSTERTVSGRRAALKVAAATCPAPHATAHPIKPHPPRNTTMIATITCAPRTSDSDRVHAAARRLYDAECALHVAHQTRVDRWIVAACQQLHEAVAEHLAAVAEQQSNSQL